MSATDLPVLELLGLRPAACGDSLFALLDVEIPGAAAELDLAVALEAKNMRRDAIEKIAIMGNHDGAARELRERLLQHAQSHQVEVIGRLIEDDEIRGLPEAFRELKAIALATRQAPDLGLLDRSAEEESCQVVANGERLVAVFDHVRPIGDLVVDGQIVAQRLAGLVDITEAASSRRRRSCPRRASRDRRSC